MNIIFVAFIVGIVLFALGIYLKLFTSWRRVHRSVLGGITLAYGLWLALFTGTVVKLVIPGVGSVALGAAAGAGVGLLTYLAVGVVGVVTGGAGIALGALGMVSIGALVGATGGAAGGMLVRVPLVSPVFWAPVVLLGAYLVLGTLRKRRFQNPAATQPLSLPDA